MLDENVPPFDILLMEDDPADANLIRTAIRECKVDCNLHHVPDGVEALAFLRQEGDPYRDMPQPDLILLDLNLPRMNGREFLAAVKADERFSGIPVVVLTTSEVERDVALVYKLGASGFITKPVDMAQFVEAMRKLLTYWLRLARLPKKG
ncbi:MAG TPA: response regulator [Gallionella sp.]|nr:response regulator [Gallionella sp.]